MRIIRVFVLIIIIYSPSGYTLFSLLLGCFDERPRNNHVPVFRRTKLYGKSRPAAGPEFNQISRIARCSAALLRVHVQIARMFVYYFAMHNTDRDVAVGASVSWFQKYTWILSGIRCYYSAFSEYCGVK